MHEAYWPVEELCSDHVTAAAVCHAESTTVSDDESRGD